MTHGQHGAEVLAQVMRAVFEPLIDSVYARGGWIATQAGDAFTALFPGEVAPASCRALATAWDIQGLIESNFHHFTPYGDFTISAKVGLALGEAAWGIITSADGQRAVCYFQGSAVDGCAEAEHYAQAGEIILEAAFYQQVLALVSVQTVGEYYRLASLTGRLPDRLPVTLRAVDLDLASHFFPRALVTQRFSGEFRRVVTVFFSLPTLHTEAQLGSLVQLLFELQKRYGGLLRGLDFGDKGANVLLFWGAPTALEDDVERALNFILELQAHTEIPIHGGVTARVAHAGFIGSPLSEEYTAYGRGINLAARFMTSAPRGEIWVDEPVAQQAEGRFVLEFVGARSFKGFAEPQNAYSLLERKDTAEIFYEAQFQSREMELQELASFVQPALQGSFAGMLVVWGEPGVGKSRLVHEFLRWQQASAPGKFRTFLGQTDAILRESLNPFRYWLKNYFGVSNHQVEARNKRSFNRKLDELIAVCQEPRLAAELDRTRSFIGALVGLHWPDSLFEQLDAQGRHENTFLALSALLQTESRQGPVIFFLEDAHWLDDDSKEFLPRLVRVLTADEHITYPFAILATARLAGAGLPLEGIDYRQMTLGQLDQAALTGLAESLLKGPGTERLVQLLEERSEGNPFFAEQILRFLMEGGRLVWQESGWSARDEAAAALPASLQAVLVARLDRLAPGVKEVVQLAAVLGREFDVNLLARMMDADEQLPDKLQQAEQADIWAALGEAHYLFKHALLRDAAYAMQLRARRQALHALALKAYEEVYAQNLQDQYGELAYHAEQASLGESARRYLVLAGQTAQDAYENPLATEYFSRALVLTPTASRAERCGLLLAREALFEVQGKTSERQHDLDELERLVPELGDSAQAARIALRRASLTFDLADFQKAIEQAGQAATQAEAAMQVELAIKARSLVASAQLRLNEPEAAAEQVELGLALARRTSGLMDECHLLNTRGLVAIEQRDFGLARSAFEEALQLARRAGDLRAQALPLNNLGMIAGFTGNYPAAKAFYEQALVISRQIGVRSGEGLVLGNLGWVAGVLGEIEKARAYAEENIRISREVGDLYNQVYALINLSASAGAMGDPDKAIRYAEEGLTLARRIGERSAEAWSLTYLGHSRFASGELQAAAGAYQAALDLRRALDQPLLATEPQAGLARLAIARGDLAGARAYLEPILPILEQGGDLAGADEPLRVYLTGYLVLKAIRDPRAHSILAAGYNLLQDRADAIPDPATRQGFLQNIETHRAIRSAWEESQ